MPKGGNMEYLDLFLKEEDRLMLNTVRRFVDNEIMPVRQKIDDDKDHVLVTDIVRKMADIGLFRAIIPPEYGGDGMPSPFSRLMLRTELCRGDLGINLCWSVTEWALRPAILAENKAVLEKFAPLFTGDELHLGCFAVTEPHSGCDVENLERFHGRSIHVRASLEGDQWVINGQKSLASNSGVADLYCVLCQTDPELGEDGIVLLYVPHPIKGLTFGKFETKAGAAADRNCDVYFDDVRVPKEYCAAGPGNDKRFLRINIAAGRIGSAANALGNAQGIFEQLLRYTGERIVGGKPIRRHSIAAGMIADMAIGIEAAKAFLLQTAYMGTKPELYGAPDSHEALSRASSVKVYVTDMAVNIANKAMELMGSYGYFRDYDIEKYWRDNKIIQLWLGGAQLARFDVVRGYYNYE
jgi:alkylation response protein AidB-like acyl-CoA dehydrogenase